MTGRIGGNNKVASKTPANDALTTKRSTDTMPSNKVSIKGIIDAWLISNPNSGRYLILLPSGEVALSDDDPNRALETAFHQSCGSNVSLIDIQQPYPCDIEIEVDEIDLVIDELS